MKHPYNSPRTELTSMEPRSILMQSYITVDVNENIEANQW